MLTIQTRRIQVKEWRFRMALFVISLVATVGIVVANVERTSAETGGYPYASYYGPGSNPVNSYWTDPNGNPFSSYGYYYRNCTDYVAWKLHTLNVADTKVRGLGNAGEWAINASGRSGVLVDTIPSYGAVAVKVGDKANPSGHVAFIKSLNSGGTITVSEYNWIVNKIPDGMYHERTGTPSELGFSKFIHFGVSNNAAGVTAMSSNVTSNGVQHVYSGLSDGRVYETWWMGGSSGGPSTSFLADENSEITSISNQITDGGVKHVYFGTQGGKVYETWWSDSHSPSTNEISNPGHAVTSISSQVTSGQTQHVYFGTSDGQVREAWRPVGGSFSTATLANVGSPVKTMSSQVGSNGVQHVYFGTADGKVRETWWLSGSGSSPSTHTIASAAAAVTALSSQITGVTQHVYWGSSDGKIRETWWNSGAPSTSQIADKGSAVVSLASQVGSNGVQHVYFSTTAKKVYETWWLSGSGNGPSTGQIASSGSPITALSSQLTGTNTQHVYFGTLAEKIYETWWSSGGGGPSTLQIDSF